MGRDERTANSRRSEIMTLTCGGTPAAGRSERSGISSYAIPAQQNATCTLAVAPSGGCSARAGDGGSRSTTSRSAPQGGGAGTEVLVAVPPKGCGGERHRNIGARCARAGLGLLRPRLPRRCAPQSRRGPPQAGYPAATSERSPVWAVSAYTTSETITVTLSGAPAWRASRTRLSAHGSGSAQDSRACSIASSLT